MARTFQEFAAENLAGFGFSITAADIPEYQTTVDCMNKITEWTNSVDDRTWGIIRSADLSDGLWYEGYFESWPQAYQLFNGNPSGTYVDTKKNIITCLEHAKQQADDEPAGLAGGTGIADVVGESSQ
jgi:hypothetical protein